MTQLSEDVQKVLELVEMVGGATEVLTSAFDQMREGQEAFGHGIYKLKAAVVCLEQIGVRGAEFSRAGADGKRTLNMAVDSHDLHNSIADAFGEFPVLVNKYQDVCDTLLDDLRALYLGLVEAQTPQHAEEAPVSSNDGGSDE